MQSTTNSIDMMDNPIPQEAQDVVSSAAQVQLPNEPTSSLVEQQPISKQTVAQDKDVSDEQPAGEMDWEAQQNPKRARSPDLPEDSKRVKTSEDSAIGENIEAIEPQPRDVIVLQSSSVDISEAQTVQKVVTVNGQDTVQVVGQVDNQPDAQKDAGLVEQKEEGGQDVLQKEETKDTDMVAQKGVEGEIDAQKDELKDVNVMVQQDVGEQIDNTTDGHMDVDLNEQKDVGEVTNLETDGKMDIDMAAQRIVAEKIDVKADDQKDVEMSEQKDVAAEEQETSLKTAFLNSVFADEAVKAAILRTCPPDSAPVNTFRNKVSRPAILTKKLSPSEEKKEKWMFFSNQSPFSQANTLAQDLAQSSWDLLEDDERAYLLSLLPEVDLEYEEGKEVPKLVDKFFVRNQIFKQCCREFGEDLRDAFLDDDFLRDACRAASHRKKGKFDNWKDLEFEKYWGQKQKLPTFGIVAGQAAQISLVTLIKNRYLQAGDTWAYYRKFATGGEVIKEVVCTAVNPDFSLNFRIPRGNAKFLDPSSDSNDIVLNNVTKPQLLENTILRQHSDCPARIPNGNAFKVFRIHRNNLDKGALWELRQHYHERMTTAQ